MNHYCGGMTIDWVIVSFTRADVCWQRHHTWALPHGARVMLLARLLLANAQRADVLPPCSMAAAQNVSVSQMWAAVRHVGMQDKQAARKHAHAQG